jgi:hypothetical protein
VDKPTTDKQNDKAFRTTKCGFVFLVQTPRKKCSDIFDNGFFALVTSLEVGLSSEGDVAQNGAGRGAPLGQCPRSVVRHSVIRTWRSHVARREDQGHLYLNCRSRQRSGIAHNLVVRRADRQFDGAHLVIDEQHCCVFRRKYILHE